MSNQPPWSYKPGNLIGTILDRTSKTPGDIYEVKLSTGDTLEGRLSAPNQDSDHLHVTSSDDRVAYVSLAHVVFVRPKK